METLSLNGDGWHLAQARAYPPDVAELDRLDGWVPAIVPGDVRLDLQRAGRLPEDLYFGRNSLKTKWVENHDWWYVREIAAELQPGEHAELVLYGVDYVSWVFWNGVLLGRHEGMFSTQVYDISAHLARQNRLAIFILGAGHLPRRTSRSERLLDRLENQLNNPVTALNYRRQVVKSQMSFGWDFAPDMRTMGIWDDAELRLTGPVVLRDPYALPVLGPGESARVRLTLIANAREATRARLVVTLRGTTWDAAPQEHVFQLELGAGNNALAFEVPVTEPRLWYPWDRGKPDLYELALMVTVDGAPSDSWHRTIGLRSVHMHRNRESPPGASDWTFVINGAPLFARGANWVPADAFPARVQPADYHALLRLAVESNMNMLRVWGGGLREKRAFYEEADRLGLMLWQEFPHACAFNARFPRSAEYLALAESESRAIVRALRNHPSVVMWCGGNEFSPRRNWPLVAALRRAAQGEDGSRPFNPASPSGGESHNWIVWHQQAPVAEYRRDQALFASEFGLQAAPDVEMLRRFVPADELWPPGETWLHHRAELAKLAFYARPYLDESAPTGRAYHSEWARNFASAEEFALITQQAQADGLQVAIEHFRRGKGRCSGVLLWQLNEPWPGISWAIVDYYRVPKLAYERVTQAYSPLLVSLDFPLRTYLPGERLVADVWAINDWPHAFPGLRLAVVLGDPATAAPVWSTTLDVPADSAQKVGQLSVTVPPGRASARALVTEAWQGERLLSANGYQLDTHDWRQLGRVRRWLAQVGKRIFE